MSFQNEQTIQVSPRERRRTRQRTPFGDEDVQVVFAGMGISSMFQRRVASNRGTALFYHTDMLLHENQLHSNHPECPDRLQSAYDKCVRNGLVNRCLIMQPHAIPDEVLLLAHTQEYIDTVASTADMADAARSEYVQKFDAACFNKDTHNAARLAAGALWLAVDMVSRGDTQNAFCLVRPPGHHAMKDEPCGFCVFNNVEIAAKRALEEGRANRVLIVDWDAHHGQATQYAFYDNPRVLYFSIHRYDQGTFWPSLRESDYDFVGQGPAYGYNINVPLDGKDYGDSDYLTIFNTLLMPIAYEFDPDLVIVSAGYDSVMGCPLGALSLTPAVYAHLTHHLMALADGKVVVALEGGYNVESLGDAVSHTISALLGDPLPPLQPMGPILPGTHEAIRKCVSVLRTKWRSLSVFPIENPQPLKDMTGLSVNSWKSVMMPATEVESSCRTEDEIAVANAKLVELRKDHSFTVLSGLQKVCLVYDSRMENHKNERERRQPECPARTRRAYELLEEYGITRRCKRTDAREALEEELLRVHTKEYVDSIRQTASMSQEDLNAFADRFDSVYLNKHTFDSASLSAGSLLSVVDDVCGGEALRGVAVTRPPGHHAEKDHCMGFCFFNNIAIAARHAQTVHGRKRIAIIDWDVHHGNGIQHIFEEDPDVLYLSLHRYDDGRFFPNSSDAAAAFCGRGKGVGKNINLPWGARPVRDGDYITAFLHLVLPVLYEFRPQLTFVAAGFDAVRGDHLGGMAVSVECFGHLTHLLLSTATLNPAGPDGKPRGGLILALEGGYNLMATAEALSQCVASLLSDTCLRLAATSLAPTEKCAKAIRNAIEVQRQYWPCLFDYNSVSCYLDHATLARTQASIAVAAATAAAAASSNATTVPVSNRVSTEGQTFTGSPTTETGAIGFGTHVATGVSFESITSSVSLGVSPTQSLTTYTHTTIIESLAGTQQSAQLAVEGPPSVTLVHQPPAMSSNDLDTAQSGGAAPAPPPSSGSATTEASQLPDPSAPNPAEGALDPVAGPSTGPAADGNIDPANLSSLVQFADAGIEDLTSFFGLDASEPTPERVFAVEPILWCCHLDEVTSAANWRPEVTHPCSRCENRHENWVCLTCYQVYCGRYAQGHMLEHHSASRHPIVLGMADLSAWCYTCNSYVHNETLMEAKRLAHLAKFGEAMPS